MPTKRVLIVDDERELGRLLQAALGTLDAKPTVVVVPSAEEAQLEASKNTVDLIISDVSLPGMSGIELTRRLRARYKSIKTIQITDLRDPTLEGQAREAGAEYFFTKPLAMPAFLSAVEKLLDLKESDQAPSPSAAADMTVQTNRLTGLLGELRQSLAAEFAALFDDQGRILFQEVNLNLQTPSPELLSALAEALLTGNKVSRLLSAKDRENVLAFKGRALDLLITTVSTGFNLLLVLKGGRAAIRLAIAFDGLLAARKEMQALLADMGIALQLEAVDAGRPVRIQTRPLKLLETTPTTVPAARPEKPPEAKTESQPSAAKPEASPAARSEKPFETRPESQPAAAKSGTAAETAPEEMLPKPPSAPETAPALEAAGIPSPAEVAAHAVAAKPAADGEAAPVDFDKLFGSKGKKEGKPGDIDAFWDRAIQSAPPTPSSEGLTYEQARKMGLAPENLPDKK